MSLDQIIDDNMLGAHSPREYKIGRCRGMCGLSAPLTILVRTPSMTAYVDDEMNRPSYFCCACSREYLERMEDQWADYYSMIR